ncbi:uncharacterized protein LOC110714598 isoform X2 [Chenopodium quinoa]|uniref:uncharacterized protein LOC110714598 isoform X2 n=1 Tax=Chenopodium quinoa TaxID=63459 RepID=UPI000B7949DD|nr:uncharacterized protein LOC110714598 isoform X2 [Chenopodium quinoa]
MGGHEGWPQPSGLHPNGLLPNETASAIRVLDSERWLKAEERIEELIARIQPNQPSEQRRNAVADYVQRLIMKCFPCQVFTFGSVPLKTYLPDGDIDLTAFSKNQTLKNNWATQVRDILESEEKNENAEFHVKEVQYIQAEVKIIKCLVENIVVDISFNQLGGLCTLCFLEEVDHLINQNHLFKRSIILIKAWCYYESRILGAHHGLISTYALETLVLYIFHVFNNTFTGPLEVLYRFLEFFSNFDWDNFCVSLWGPVPISSLPDVTAEPPRKDSGDLLLSKLFLDACSSVYAVFPEGLENQGQPFISKHFNVIDPLRVNNNLGRSVSKGNFYRIRSAFTFGAKRLARLLDCSDENIVIELNQFFMNTWERHGSGVRPDVPSSDLWPSLANPDDRSNNQDIASSSKNASDNVSIQETQIRVPQSNRPLTSQRASYPLESISKNNEVPAASCTQDQKSIGNPNSSEIMEQVGKGNAQSLRADRNKKSLKPDHMLNEIQGKYLFARTRSSPELTNAYYDASSRGRRGKPTDSGRSQVASSKMDSNRRKNIASETLSTQSTLSSSDDLLSGRYNSHHAVDVAADSMSVSNSHVGDSGTGIVSEDHTSVTGAQGMHQEEQDLVNMMASSSLHNFGGQVPMPLNLASSHLPLPIPQSVLASMGYNQRGMAGMVPANIPVIDPHWAANLHFQQGFSSPLTPYFPGVGFPAKSEALIEQGDENFSSVEIAQQGADTDHWHERDVTTIGGQDDVSLEMHHVDDRQPSTSGNSSFGPSSRMANSGSFFKAQTKVAKELRTSMRDDYVENLQRQDNRENEVYSDDRVTSARFSSASQAGSVRSKTSSESSWDGSSTRVSKVAREKQGRKTAVSSSVPPIIHSKDKNIYNHSSADLDDENRDWNSMSTKGVEINERSIVSQHASTLHVPRHHLPGYEVAQTSGSDSVMPIAPMVLGPASRQIKFYPTGPPVPFFTMLHFPPEAGTSDRASSSPHGEVGSDDIDSVKSIGFSAGHDAPDVYSTYNSIKRAITTESSEEPKPDILNSDFASHWQNLQFGRFCQSPRFPPPAVCPSPVAAPPMYLQGCFPWDGPGRPLPANANLLSQLMSYGPRFVPVPPVQPVSSRPPVVYQHYADELPRYRSGTGTYLPNPASVRDRHSSGARRNSYNYDRSDHSDREGNWNAAKARAAGRSHNRSQAEKSRVDRLPANESRADRPWSTYRHDHIPSYQAQNGPSLPSSSQSSSVNVAYGMYQMPGMNPSGVTSYGSSIPSVVMLYPYDNNSGYVSPGEQLEFGSLGPMSVVGTNDATQPIDGTRFRRAFEDQRFHRSSTQQSSPDQPSSPHFQRSMAQRNYQLKDEDFPPLIFQNPGQDGGKICNEKYSHYHAPMFAPQA